MNKTKLDILVDILKDAPDEVAAIDHHEFVGNMGYRFMDIRPEVGSCSAIIADWFFENDMEPPRIVATALLYGILMDTDNLTRGASDFDINMFYRLYKLSDLSGIGLLRTMRNMGERWFF